MPAKKVAAMILYTSKLNKTLKFYKKLGLPLEKEVHEEGPVHYACDIEGVHFAIFEAENEGNAVPRRKGGCTQFGFVVDEVDSLFKEIIKLETEVIWEPDDFPWGRAAMITDPDGRAVEITSPN